MNLHEEEAALSLSFSLSFSTLRSTHNSGPIIREMFLFLLQTDGLFPMVQRECTRSPRNVLYFPASVIERLL